MVILALILLVVYGALALFYAAQAARQGAGQVALVLLLPFYLHYFAMLRTRHGLGLRLAPTLVLTAWLFTGWF